MPKALAKTKHLSDSGTRDPTGLNVPEERMEKGQVSSLDDLVKVASRERTLDRILQQTQHIQIKVVSNYGEVNQFYGMVRYEYDTRMVCVLYVYGMV